MKLTRLFLCGIASVSLAVPAARAGVEIIPTHGRNVYRLAVAQERGAPGDVLMIGSTYDNRVCAFAQDGTQRWDVAMGGFVFDLATGDLDGDGRDEIVAAGADGVVSVLNAEGRKLWTADLRAPVYQVAIARLDGKNPVVLASGVSREVVAFSPKGERVSAAKLTGVGRMMRAGDFDGDGADEVAVMPVRGQAKDVRFMKGMSLDPMPKRQISLMQVKQIRTKSGAAQPKEHPKKNGFKWKGTSIKAANGLVADLNNDGAADLLFAGWGYTQKGSDSLRCLAELPNPQNPKTPAMRFLAVGDLTEHPGVEIVVVDGADIQLCQSDGKVIASAHAPFGFTDVVYLPGAPRGSILLGSAYDGDDNLYRVRFDDDDWTQQIKSLPRRGQMAAIESHIQQLTKTAEHWDGQPMNGTDGPFDVMFNHHMWSNSDIIDQSIKEVRSYEKIFPYSRLRFSVLLWPGEKQPLLRPDGTAWTRDVRLADNLTREQIAAGARKLEKARCHFWVQVGHGCAPHCSVEAVAAILEAAPTMCLGFVSAEDAQADQMAYYYEHHIQPILELCLKYGKHFVPRNNDVWLAHWPTDAKMRELIFNDRYSSVLLPCGNDTSSRVVGIHGAARMGLWMDGQADGWSSRCSKYMFNSSIGWGWGAPMTGHPQLRYYVSHALLGAQLFMMFSDERDPTSGEWTRVGMEGAVPFLHLLGQGVITPPRREQLRAISQVALVMQQPSERFIKHGGNAHHVEYWGKDGSDGKPWTMGQLDDYWTMVPLLPTDVSTYLWGRTRRDPSHIPVTTPHGFVCLLTGETPRAGGPWKTVWTTDGDTLQKSGRDYTLAEARTAMLDDLAEGEKRLPFHVEGHMFHQVIEQSPDYYIIALVDPGWLDPADRTVKLTARLPGIWKITDRLSGEAVGTLAAPLEFLVSAGTLRLLEARRN